MIKRVISICFIVILTAIMLATGCKPSNGTEPPLDDEKQVLNLYNIDPWTLDPALSSEMTSHEYIMQIFSGLVRLDDDLEPVPDIAKSWQFSSDNTTYTFTLREDVRFQDGRQVTADDIKYSWERACDPATGSTTAATYLGDIIGAKDKLAGISSEISGIRVIDSYTIEVEIEAPYPYFLYKLAYPTAFIVDRLNVESGDTWWLNPNGTGPFKLGQWTYNSLLVLERNELYYGGKPLLRSVVFHLWAGVPMNLYELNQIDVASISAAYVDKVTDESGTFYAELMIVPQLSFTYIGFNGQEPPFDDANIRLAFSRAIDKDKLISLGMKDMAERADGILPPGIPGYNEALLGLDYDVEEALELIEASKYGSVEDLPSITITTSGWGGLISGQLEAVVYQWKENLGVDVTVRQLEPEAFFYELRDERDEMIFLGWIADYPHPQDFLEVLFHSESEHNYGDYSNSDIDSLLEEARLEADFNLSLELYRQIEQLLVEDAACLPLWFSESYILVKPYVKGYSLNVMGFASLNTTYIETQ